ncbi:class I SAM-dependent methyltransferase [Reichenbachiella ulvae]|uniref:SAM-dependent methyltransferase n=1 Tax=Reichenbachiella ulvae TaxID=2980104 RepID=A0ABT3CV02_9BACT|nr:SAM-dependent methyltransferase [Reichenbachiella ulvae]MCV9387530.1 SAM-dependent methyltransferase [Reichenbachiella ulvae]
MSKPAFLQHIKESLQGGTFVKLTLSKPFQKSSSLQNLYVRPIEIKNETVLNFLFRHLTQDETKNFDFEEGLKEVAKYLETHFKNAVLCTTTIDYTLLTSKKGKTTLQKKAVTREIEDVSHDKQKKKRSTAESTYLQKLGISDSQGNIIPKMADKYRQINKFLEIMESLLDSASLPPKPKIVDMGSGKGYLTFALYDYLTQKGLDVQVTGIELRKDLVDFCNQAATELGFDGLNFLDQPIEEYNDNDIDILIALHACDTATDDALAKGIASKAALIVSAPCCHKQIRKQLKGKPAENPILKYGIFKERQYEMVTDTIRALLLEREGYESKIFEFVSNEHTRKNVMLVGINHHNTRNSEQSTTKIQEIKKEFGIEYQQLERLLGD